MSHARRVRSTAERVTFSVACAVLAVVIAAIASLGVGGPGDAPAFTVSSLGTREVGGRFHVRASVENEGDQTAENVQVVANLKLAAGDPEEAEQVIDFLSGGDEEEVEFVFARNPSAGELDIEVRSFKAR